MTEGIWSIKESKIHFIYFTNIFFAIIGIIIILLFNLVSVESNLITNEIIEFLFNFISLS